MVEAVRRDRDHVTGLAAEQVHDEAFAGITGAARPPAPPRPSGPSFADLCDRYLSAPERAGLSPKTRLKYEGMFRVLRDLLGAGTQAADITRADCRRAQAVLLAMPANAAQRYPGLKAQQAADTSWTSSPTIGASALRPRPTPRSGR